MSQDELTVVNGWALYAHPVFLNRLENLVAEVEQIFKERPDDAVDHPAWKLLECVRRAIGVVVPSDPQHRNFLQGGTLGRNLTHWRRVKRTLPQRYRLFFQFRSEAPRSIIYAWLNDTYCLRKEGAKTDCYAVFKQMVASGKVPNSYQDLLVSAQKLPAG